MSLILFLYVFLEATTTFMLLGLEVFPLGLNLVVQLQFRITFSIFKTNLLIHRNQIIEQ